MKTRILSGLVLIALLVTALPIGGWYLYFFCLVASIMGMFEFYKAFDMESTIPAWIGYISAVSLYVAIKAKADFHIELMIIVFSLIALLICYVFTHKRTHASVIITAYFALFYIAVMLSFIYRTRSMAGGAYAVWLIFIGSWVNDTCAYFIGYFFGKHKMAPELSPKKTTEGAIGGIAGATIVGLIFGIIVTAVGSPFGGITPFIFTIAGLAGSFCGIIGDLAASAIKRNVNIKDYGSLIPGHGGILDRFDSVILTAPVVYFAIYLLQ